jgi:hypothetical protein
MIGSAFTSSPGGSSDSSGRSYWVLLPLVGGALLVLLAVGLIVYLGLRDVFFKGEPVEGMPLPVTKEAAIPTPALTPTPSVQPLPTPACETVISSGDTQVMVSLPISMTVKDRQYPVVAVSAPMSGEEWRYTLDYPSVAAWVCGSVVNYVVGLEPTEENEALLLDLRPGDELTLQRSNGVQLFFRFSERREAEPDDARIFAQSAPRLSVVLPRETGNWQIAIADYVSESEPVQPTAEALARPGEAVRVGDVQLIVEKGHVNRDADELSPGTMYYLVEFSIENTGTDVLRTDNFNMVLRDSAGNEYLLSPIASAAGDYGPLDAEISPGAVIQGSAGYLTPRSLPGPSVVWRFSPHSASESRVSVSVPYEAEPEATPVTSVMKAQVSITDVFLDSSEELVIIEGEVENTGIEAFTVEVGDVKLTSSAGIAALRSAAPPLPWTLDPGETQIVEFQYERPGAATALLSLLGYSFEIRGLE